MITILWEAFHFIEFAILYLLLVAAFRVNKRYTELNDILAVVIAAIYAFIDEIHQFYIPGRSFSQLDLVKDITGIIIAWAIVGKFYLKNLRKDE